MQELRLLIAAAQESAALRIRQELAVLPEYVCCASSALAAKEELEKETFSAVLILLPLSGEGLRLALSTARDTDSAVIVAGKADELDQTDQEKLAQAGVLFLSRPLSRERLAMALECAKCMHHRLQYIRREDARLKIKMREMQAVGRAKELLMKTLGMTEPQAHHFIEKQAMDARQTKAEVAMRILRTYENS
ncbi:MAG: ANTAR domain-containing protein [Clostridiales bacterium]|nr:ANTAR domain-containing protein [Clostridiales bacterium]